MSIGWHSTVFVCTGTYCVLVCFGMYCMYMGYLYVLVIYQSVFYVLTCCTLYSKQCVQLARIDSICMYLLVLMYSMHIAMFACIDLKVFACIGLHCLH